MSKRPRDSGFGGQQSSSSDEENSTNPQHNPISHTRVTNPSTTATTSTPTNTSMTSTAIQGSQLNAISKYDGTADVEAWIAEMDRAAIQFKWDDAQTAAAAKGKLTDGASQWLRSAEMCSYIYNIWKDGTDKSKMLSEALIARFGVEMAATRATDAVRDLKQKHDESVGSFHDRVVRQLDKKNYKYTQKEKQEASYQKGFAADICTFFGAGLREEIRQRVLSVPNPPQTHQELLKAAKVVEATESTAATRAKANVLEIQNARPSSDMGEAISMESPPSGWSMEEMTLCMVEAMRKFKQPSGKKFTCFNCKGEGHYSSECPSPKKKTGYKESAVRSTQWGRQGAKKKGKKFEELQHEEGFTLESGNDSGEE